MCCYSYAVAIYFSFYSAVWQSTLFYCLPDYFEKKKFRKRLIVWNLFSLEFILREDREMDFFFADNIFYRKFSGASGCIKEGVPCIHDVLELKNQWREIPTKIILYSK